MRSLVADRFIEWNAQWMDLATGEPIRLRLTTPGTLAQQVMWADRCATFARLRHPVLNSLVDFGVADNAHLFEAYSAGTAITANGPAAARLLCHAARFLEAHGIPLTHEVAGDAVRSISTGPAGRRRPVGVVLQNRRALEHLRDALSATEPGGVTMITVTGPPGSGLDTLRLLAAREARLHGYVPVTGASLLAVEGLVEHLCDRHVLLLSSAGASSSEREALAAFAIRLGASSARRHVLLHFASGTTASAGTLPLGPLGISAMTAMVFADRESDPAQLFEAIREAGGRPGALVSRLAGNSASQRSWLVHETTPEYAAATIHEVEARPTPTARRGGIALAGAGERASRLARAGRHASAVRLLMRAVRVLELRGKRDEAAQSSIQLAWLLRDRGHQMRALEQFQHARMLASDQRITISAAIGAGVISTDDDRLLEAESALRSAASAAALLRRTELEHRAVLALARCLFWQSRFEESVALLEPAISASGAAEAYALAARVRAAMHDATRAVPAAAESVRRSQASGEPREIARAARAMTLARAALDDVDGACAAAHVGLGAAASGHLPLPALRIRAALYTALQRSSSSSLEARRLVDFGRRSGGRSRLCWRVT